MKLTYKTYFLGGNTRLAFSDENNRSEMTLTFSPVTGSAPEEEMIYGADGGTTLHDMVQEQLEELMSALEGTMTDSDDLNFYDGYSVDALLSFENILIEVKWNLLKAEMEA